LKTIAKDCNISLSTVQRSIKELEDLKLIVVLKFENKENKYVNNIYKIFYPIIHEEKEIYEIPQLTQEQLKQLESIEKEIYEIVEEEEEKDEE
jgi:DNA-binding Lrp family transcriptional regulator